MNPDPNNNPNCEVGVMIASARTETAKRYEDAVRQMLKGFLEAQTDMANMCKNPAISEAQREVYRRKIYGLDYARSIAINTIRVVNPDFKENIV